MRILGTDHVYEVAITAFAALGHNNAVVRLALLAEAPKANSQHEFSTSLVRNEVLSPAYQQICQRATRATLDVQNGAPEGAPS